MENSTLFNSQFHAAEELSLIFTAREAELHSLSDYLEETHPKKHRLIVAPWGGGKTHFLSMLYHRIRGREALSSKWFPAFILGRDSSCSSFGDLLDGLFSQTRHLPQCAEYQEKYWGIRETGVDIENQWEKISELFMEIVRNKNKKFLLCIDDFDVLLDFLLHDPSSKLLSSFFSLREAVAIIGTAAANPMENKKYSAFLSESFAHISLPPFNEKETLALLEKKTGQEENSHVTEVIRHNISSLKALFHFTRGNPRLICILRHVLLQQKSFTPLNALRKMLDILSPHYRFLIQNTPVKERKLLDCLLRKSEWISPSELARNLTWEGKEVSVLLKRLIDRGLVKKVRIGAKKSFYGAADPLFRAYYHIQFVEDLKNHPGQIMDFLHNLYSCRKWNDDKKPDAAKTNKSIRGLYYLEPPTGRPADSKIQAIYKLFNERKSAEIMKGIQDILETSERPPEEKSCLLLVLGFIHSLKGEHQKAIDCYKKCSEDASHAAWFLNNMGCDYRFLGLAEKAMGCFLRSLEHREDFPPALVNLGETYCRLGRFRDAADCFSRFDGVVQGTPIAEELKEPALQMIFEAYSFYVEGMWSGGKEGESLIFLENRLPFIQSLPPRMASLAVTSFFWPLAKPETVGFAIQALAIIEKALPTGTTWSLRPISIALQYLESDKEEVLLSQNEEVRDAVRLMLRKDI